MKKQMLVLTVAGLCMFGLSQCKTAEKAVATAPLGNTELETARLNWPDATLANLENGKMIHEGVCTKCHGLKAIDKFSEEEWRREIDKMAPMARISEEQKTDLTMYILTLHQLKK